MISLTENQRRAVINLDQNLIVEAGAGSGKTSVLTEHYLQCIKGGVTHHQIVAITFTEKAADEMVHRIRAGYPLPADEIWVSTIHAFCAKLLRHHPFEAKIDPIFTIIDETTAELRRQKTLRSYLDTLCQILQRNFRKH